MKVKFQKTRFFFEEEYYSPVGIVDFNSLSKILRKQFKSIKFEHGFWKKQYFRFDDISEEAYFLLWSNDGIEI